MREKDSQTAGTGLGLAICRGIIGAHDGTIRARAGDNGRGATIEVRLPLVVPPRNPETGSKAMAVGTGDG